MKFPILKGVSIVSGVLVISFVFAFGAYQISVQRKFQQKVEAFKQGGINVVYQGVAAHLRPISLDTFESDVEKILPLPLQERRSAAIRFEKNHYMVDEDIPQVALDSDSLKNDLEGRIRTFSSVPIEVKLKTESAEVTKSDLEGALPELKKHFNNKFTLTSKDFSIPVWFRDHLDLLAYRKTIDPSTGNTVIKMEFQSELFMRYVAQDWGKVINSDPVKVKIARDEKGKILFDGHGRNGRVLDSQKLKDMLVEAINSQDITIEKSKLQLPIEEKLFEVDVSNDLKEMGIREMVSIGHTSYYGSPKNRMFNINVGVGKFNGVVIAPNEVFSFNSHLGPVDGAHGFLKELVIKPEGTLPEFGGGLCQVSTTAYRGALYAGIPIVERSPHSYAVGYYSQIGGHGIDATIYPGAHDLRFKNDTPGSLLLQAYTEGSEAYFVFYGTKDGREVRLEGPVITNRNSIPGTDTVETDTIPVGTQKTQEKAHVGFHTLWYRYITLPGGLTQKEAIESSYRAVKEKVLVGVEKKPELPVPTVNKTSDKNFID